MELLRSLLKWMRTHRLLSVLFVVIVIGAVVIVNFITTRSDGTLSEPVQKGTIIESVYGIGTVTANKIYRISPGVVNTIAYLYVKEGDDVKKSQKLFGNEARSEEHTS